MKALAKQKSLFVDIAVFSAVAIAAALTALQVKNQMISHYLGGHTAKAAAIDQQLADVTSQNAQTVAMADGNGCSCPMCCAVPSAEL